MNGKKRRPTKGNRPDCTNIPDTNLPDEIFEHHIWTHFSFNQWITVFSLVCKKWKRICEESTVDPKQIQIKFKSIFDIGRYMQIVKKYQPTILKVKVQCAEYRNDLFMVHRLCEASKRLHTLVLDCQRYNFDMYVKPIKHISTLALKVNAMEKFWQNLQTIFPNLKRLQVEEPNHPFNIKVDHLTLVIRSDSSLNKFRHLHADVIVTQKDKKIVTKLGSDSANSRELTYEEYFRYFGNTELFIVLQQSIDYQNLQWAAKLLRSGRTTMEYEKQLYSSNDSYQYPSAISRPSFDSKAYWSNIVESATGYEALIQTNLIPVPTWRKFVALCNFKSTHQALAVLYKLDDASLTDRFCGHEIRKAFFEDFLPLASKSELRQRRAIENVKKIVQSANIAHIQLKDFKKIANLRDWSDHNARTDNVEIYHAMIAAGCKISMNDFGDFAQKHDVGIIIDLLVQKQPAKVVDALVYCPLDKLKSIMAKHSIALTIEKEVSRESLFNQRIRQHVSKEEELVEYKHLVNHMDGSGTTPLSIALAYPSKRVLSTVQKLLELGADPNLHRGDKLSPLGWLLAEYDSYDGIEIYHVIDVINLLVEFGADINAPCLYEQRMCSPLMIAVRNEVEEDIIRFLVALGCRTDYADEKGATILVWAKRKSDVYHSHIAELLK